MSWITFLLPAEITIEIIIYMRIHFILHARLLNSFSYVWFFVSLWIIASQAPLSMGFSRQEYWSGFPCPPPGDLPDPGVKPRSLMSPALADSGFPGGSTGKESVCSAGDLGLIPGLERSPGEGKGYPIQYSGLEHSMDYSTGLQRVRHDWETFTFFTASATWEALTSYQALTKHLLCIISFNLGTNPTFTGQKTEIPWRQIMF